MIEILSTTAREFWILSTEMAPYLLFGFIMAGILSVLIPPEKVEKHLGGRSIPAVIKASLFGVPLPLCSCSVLPVATSLRKHGAGRGAIISFLISTPQTGVDSILATYSLLGLPYAIFRPLAAFFSGIAGGFMEILLGEKKPDGSEEAPPPCTDSCCSGKDRKSLISRALEHSFVTLPRELAVPLLSGLIIAGLISAVLPDDFFARTVGTGFFSMLLMLIIGIPFYVCATASVPIAVSLIEKGVSPGAALVFLMTGPASNAAAITTIFKILGKRSTIIYLLTLASTAIFSGILLDHILFITDSTVKDCHDTRNFPGLPSSLVTIFLLALLVIHIPKIHSITEHSAEKQKSCCEIMHDYPTVEESTPPEHCSCCQIHEHPQISLKQKNQENRSTG